MLVLVANTICLRQVRDFTAIRQTAKALGHDAALFATSGGTDTIQGITGPGNRRFESRWKYGAAPSYLASSAVHPVTCRKCDIKTMDHICPECGR